MGSFNAILRFLKEKGTAFGLRFNAAVPSLLHDSTRLPDGNALDYHLLSLPLYMVGQARADGGGISGQVRIASTPDEFLDRVSDNIRLKTRCAGTAHSGQRIGQVRIYNPPVVGKKRDAEDPGRSHQNPVGRIPVKRVGQRRHLSRNRRGDSLPPH